MTEQNGENPETRRLDTWKEIAAYFGRDERTVKRWEASRGLPIRRIPGGVRASVYAYESELAAWLHDDPQASPADGTTTPAPEEQDSTAPFTFRHWARRWWLAAAALLLGVATYRLISHDDHLAERVPTPHDAQAMAFYRAGLYGWQTRTPAGLTRAVDDFTRAIKRDPNYAEAYAGLANCYNLLREYTTMPPDRAYPRAKIAAERAIALDPSLAEAHASLAFVDFYWSRDVQGARREFERALALQPHNAMVHHWYATFLMTVGESRKALIEIDKAAALDSESTAILADKGLILINFRKYKEATALLQRLEQAEPAFLSPHLYLALIHLALGDYAAYLAEVRAGAELRHDKSAKSMAAAATAGLASGGREGMFRAILAEESRLYAEGKEPAYFVAETYARLNDDADALVYLKISLSRHEADNVALAIDSSFDHLRPDPDFQLLLRKAGLSSGA